MFEAEAAQKFVKNPAVLLQAEPVICWDVECPKAEGGHCGQWISRLVHSCGAIRSRLRSRHL